MRILAVAIAFCLLPTLALAADVCGSARKAGGHQRGCCHRIVVLCGQAKHGPRCYRACHKPAAPLIPCAEDICIAAACHQPVTPLIPCAKEICIEPGCHKPAVVFMPEEPCGCEE